MIDATNIPKRIVLSRKGFDSSFGGCASPIIDGRLVSLPIPERHSDKSDLRFCDLRDRSCVEIVNAACQLSNGKINESTLVHLDPDLRIELRAKEHKHLRFAFGQSGSSQTELKNVSPGDLFLFFGWFREVVVSTGRYRFCRNSPDIFAIWGWLQVGEKLELPCKLERAKELAPHHPHVAHSTGKYENNCLYVGSGSLDFLPTIDGAGIFATMRNDLLLSAPQGDLAPRKRLRTNWRLPSFFENISMTRVQLDGWEKEGDSIYGRAAYCPGQEFVFETTGHQAEIAKWLDRIFTEGDGNFQ